jgi:hypothetical protein
MRQLKDIEILYAFHFDSLLKNEHETRARFLPRSLEFSKHRNDLDRSGQPVVYGCRTIRGHRKVSRKQLKTVDHHAFFVAKRLSGRNKLSARERSVEFVVRSDPEPDDLFSFAYAYGTI